MESGNKKIQKTKHSLLYALMALMKSTPAQEITVAQLCREARINRTTFYKYYSVPMDIAWEQASYFFDFSLGSILTQDGDKPLSTREIMRGICKAYYENRKTLALYINFNGDLMPILTKFLETVAPIGVAHSLETSSNYYFLSGGVGAVITQWGIQGFRMPPMELADMLTDYIERFDSGISHI